nr:unnamed protein product [Callosobruchus analis]
MSLSLRKASSIEYSHILSFRRQVYIEPNQSSINLPESLEIIHDAVTYRIFLSLDSHKCFKCNRQGHIASQCPMLSQTQTNITNTTTQSYIQQEAIIREQTDKQQTSHITDDEIAVPSPGMENPAMQNFPFVVYLIHISFIACAEAGLTCLERTTCNALGYQKLYPNLDLNEDNNNRKLIRTHERICKRIDTTNDVGKPYFLVHTATELAVLIVRWYAIVTYVIHDLSSPANDAIHWTNCTFVTLHTAGLLYFLSTIHRLKHMVETMKIILLEYCTRITDEDTFLQVRLFLDKLEQHRPFTANRVFEVDLRIATPIFTNILTYVFVALQFEISDS